jgi:hypothetical protein
MERVGRGGLEMVEGVEDMMSCAKRHSNQTVHL